MKFLRLRPPRRAASSARPASRRMAKARRQKPRRFYPGRFAPTSCASSTAASRKQLLVAPPLRMRRSAARKPLHSDREQRTGLGIGRARFLFPSQRKPCFLYLQKLAVRPVARRTKRNVVEHQLCRFSGLLSQQLQLVLWRAALTTGIGKVFRKMLAPQLQNPLLGDRFLRLLLRLAPRARQGQNLPQCHTAINPHLAIPWLLASFELTLDNTTIRIREATMVYLGAYFLPVTRRARSRAAKATKLLRLRDSRFAALSINWRSSSV